MMRMQEFIERLKEKPGHVRNRIALATAGGVTGLIALGWFGVLASMGAFSITTQSVAAGENPADSINSTMGQAASGFSAITGATGGNANQSTITVVNQTQTPAAPAAEQTVLPF